MRPQDLHEEPRGKSRKSVRGAADGSGTIQGAPRKRQGELLGSEIRKIESRTSPKPEVGPPLLQLFSDELRIFN